MPGFLHPVLQVPLIPLSARSLIQPDLPTSSALPHTWHVCMPSAALSVLAGWPPWPIRFPGMRLDPWTAERSQGCRRALALRLAEVASPTSLMHCLSQMPPSCGAVVFQGQPAASWRRDPALTGHLSLPEGPRAPAGDHPSHCRGDLVIPALLPHCSTRCSWGPSSRLGPLSLGSGPLCCELGAGHSWHGPGLPQHQDCW